MIFVMLTLLSTPMDVSKVECDPVNPLQCSAPAIKGSPALLDGQVLTVDLAIALGQKADASDALVRIEVAKQKKLDQIDLVLQTALNKADLTVSTASTAAQKKQTEYWEDRAKKAEEKLFQGPPFYERAWFGFTAGIVITLVVVGVTAWELQIIPRP